MLTPRANIHRHRLPEPGQIGTIQGLCHYNPTEKYIVISYPLCDSADYRYSRGIHTVYLRSLATSKVAHVSGIWFQPLDWWLDS